MAACVVSAGARPRHYISITAFSPTRAPRPSSQRPRWTVSPIDLFTLETAKLWSIVDDHPHLVHTLSGHINRVSAVAFHPSGPLFRPPLTPRPLRGHRQSRLLLPPLGRGNGEPAPPAGRPRARRHGPVVPARREPRGDMRSVGRLPAVGPAIGAQRAGSAGREKRERWLTRRGTRRACCAAGSRRTGSR